MHYGRVHADMLKLLSREISEAKTLLMYAPCSPMQSSRGRCTVE